MMPRLTSIIAAAIAVAATPALAQEYTAKIIPYTQTMTLTPSSLPIASTICNTTRCQFLFPDIGSSSPNLVLQYVSVHYSLSAAAPETSVWMKGDVSATPVLWLPTPSTLGGQSMIISSSIFLVTPMKSRPYVVVQGPNLGVHPIQVTLSGYYATKP